MSLPEEVQEAVDRENRRYTANEINSKTITADAPSTTRLILKKYPYPQTEMELIINEFVYLHEEIDKLKKTISELTSHTKELEELHNNDFK